MAADKSTKKFFRDLTRLFKHGTQVRRKIRNVDTTIAEPDNTKSSGALLFQKSISPSYASITANAYNIAERMSRYQDFEQMEQTPEIAAALDLYCLASDTVIPLLDGTKSTVRDLFETNRTDFGVYSFDVATSAFVPGHCTKVLRTGVSQPVYKVTFSDGTFVRLTENHLVLLSDGQYCRVKHLKGDDSVRSMYTRLSSYDVKDKIDGYEMILMPEQRWKYTHRIVAEHTQNDLKGVVHHVNFNKRNNEPQNLRFMSYGAHRQLHALHNTEKWRTDKAYAKKVSDACRKHAKQLHAQPGWTQRFIERRNEVFASYDKQTRKEKFGRKGSTNGMFQNGDKITGNKNGRWDDSYVRDISKEQLWEWMAAGWKINDVLQHVRIRYENLCELCHKYGFTTKWRRDDTLDFDQVISDLRTWLSTQSEDVKLNRVFSQACKSVGITRNSAYYVLGKKGYKNWSDFLSRTNHQVTSVEFDGYDDVFDLCVEEWHNFAIAGNGDTSSYVIVHNSDETVSCDDKGRVLHVFSENDKVKESLSELFEDTLNADFNLRHWARSLVKFGDLFTLLDVHPQDGVINVVPIPVNEIEREEGYDRNDPFAFRFRWVQLGNRVLENWQVGHFRLLGRDSFLPYGSSMIEPARRIWRQLILIEDAMLVYRVVRAPDRRVFYIDVGNLPAEEVQTYVEKQKENLRTNMVVDQSTARVDIRYNPMPIHKDTPVPLLDGRTVTISQLAQERLDGRDDHWVYSVQDETGKLVPGKVTWCGKNYEATTLTKVWLDDRTYVTTAPEHPFVMRDGSNKRADELVPGDSLMPLYKQLSDKGYEECYDPEAEVFIPTHRIVASDVYPHEWKHTRARTVHHKRPWEPRNKRNNSPDNLQIMTAWEHRAWHVKNLEFTLLTPENLQKNAERLTAYNKSEKKRKRTSEQNKERNSVGAMSWYNGSDLHKKHNENRREGQLKAWAKNRDARRATMTYVVPEGIFELGAEKLRANHKLNRDRWHAEMLADPKIVEMLRSAQTGTTRDIGKMSYATMVGWLRDRGYDGFGGFKRSVLGKDVVYRGRNHKVDRIETLEVDPTDVYCMTVVGPQGEEDRHNFAVYGLGSTEIELQSGIFLRNSIDEDFYIPTRGSDSGTKIETLAGGTNAAAVDDVSYIQRKLFAALKIPKAYLGFDDALSSKATLSQEDIRFSRTIAVIQKTLISELNKVALIHLYAKGFRGDSLLDFTLRLSNPSTVAQQQKLELWRSKFEIAGSVPDGMGSKSFVYRNVWGLTDREIDDINEERLKEAIIEAKLEAGGGGEEGGGGSGGSGGGGGGGFSALLDGGEEGGGEGEEAPEGNEEAPPEGEEETGEENASELPPEEEEPGVELLLSADTDDNDVDGKEDIKLKLPSVSPDAPISPLDRALYNRSRIKHSGPRALSMPDFKTSLAHDSDALSDPFDSEWMRKFSKLGESADRNRKPRMTHDMKRMLETMEKRLNLGPSKQLSFGLVTEGIADAEFEDAQDQIDRLPHSMGDELDFDIDETLEDDADEKD